ncbi:SDR family NAD(P)-dependent oxidoreductase [Dactylosporangium sp. CA-233914]|uniref:SDR family NAD(P)-dependent oxidoreductase n=1 Tax=Dactylosporangium sp. CA-233914 TaxID=3239934 RepID=UPI003D8D5300
MPKTIVITGASDGIGAAAAQQLHDHGHRVVVVGRSPQKTRAVAAPLGADAFVADFTRLDEVRGLAAALGAAYPRIDVLANNAGGVFGDPARTADGFERTFQINHLAPFLLTSLLLPTLIESGATVIQTSSIGARMAGRLDLRDLNLERDFSPIRAYSAAKLENILFTKELHRRYHGQGVSAVAIHPGNVATNFASQTTSQLMRFIATNRLTRSLLISAERGADQLVWLSQSRPGIDWEPGGYYEKRKPARRINKQALDADLARALWDRSEQLVSQDRQK